MAAPCALMRVDWLLAGGECETLRERIEKLISLMPVDYSLSYWFDEYPNVSSW